MKSIKTKNIRNLLITFLLLILVNLISAFYFKRIDLTAEKRYTLTNYTKEKLKNLNGKIFITVYLDGKDLPFQFKKFKSAIQEELSIFEIYAGKKLDYEFVNPTQPKKSDQWRKDLYNNLYQLGIVPVETSETTEGKETNTLIFPAAVISYSFYDKKADSLITRKVGINLLNNDPHYDQSSPENINTSAQTLEYKLINEITKISKINKPKIAFLEGQGEIDEAHVIDIEKALSEYYDVMRGKIGGRYGALSDFDVVVIAKPTKPFSETDKFVLDQYLMNGGKIMWFVDGVNVSMDSIYYYGRSYCMPALPTTLKIDDQLFTYGVRINTDILQDMYCSTILLKGVSATGEARNHHYKWPYSPLLVTQNTNVINKYLDYIRTEFVSSIDTVGKNSKIKKTILLSTSNATRRIEVNVPMQIDFKEINEPIDQNLFVNKSMPVAVLLEGQFPSLWQGRITSKMMPPGAKFIGTSVPTKMIVVSDGDLIKNVVNSEGEVYPLEFDKYSLMNFKGNKQFMINAMNYLCDDEGLMQVRSREFKLRLLDKKVVNQSKNLWQFINVALPVITIILFGLIFIWIRKRKYTKKI